MDIYVEMVKIHYTYLIVDEPRYLIVDDLIIRYNLCWCIFNYNSRL